MELVSMFASIVVLGVVIIQHRRIRFLEASRDRAQQKAVDLSRELSRLEVDR